VCKSTLGETDQYAYQDNSSITVISEAQYYHQIALWDCYEKYDVLHDGSHRGWATDYCLDSLTTDELNARETAMNDELNAMGCKHGIKSACKK